MNEAMPQAVWPPAAQVSEFDSGVRDGTGGRNERPI